MTTVGYIFSNEELLKISSTQDIQNCVQTQSPDERQVFMYNLLISVVSAARKSADGQDGVDAQIFGVSMIVLKFISENKALLSPEYKTKIIKYKDEVLDTLNVADRILEGGVKRLLVE